MREIYVLTRAHKAKSRTTEMTYEYKETVAKLNFILSIHDKKIWINPSLNYSH